MAAGRSPWRADAGRLAREETIMTQDKARKVAARQRMTETGEPYSVARHAVQDEHDAPEPPRPDDWADSPAAAADDIMAGADDIMADADEIMAAARPENVYAAAGPENAYAAGPENADAVAR